MHKRAIEFSEDTVTKTDVPAIMRVEVEKTRRASEIGKVSGVFRVPRVLDFDEDAGVAVFERLHGIQPAEAMVQSQAQGEFLSVKLGAALAVIHKELQLPGDMVRLVPPQFGWPGGDVFLHGDLSTSNVCFDESDASIVILDWQMTGMLGGRATYGTRYFDLLWYVTNLIYRPKIRHLFGNPLASATKALIESYFAAVGEGYDSDDFSQYTRRFFENMRPSITTVRSRRERPLLWRSHALAKMFVNSLPAIG